MKVIMMQILLFAIPAAHADVPHPRVVHFAPAAQPSVWNGIAELRPTEKIFKEKLPIQLSEPMRRIEKTKYKPKKSRS